MPEEAVVQKEFVFHEEKMVMVDEKARPENEIIALVKKGDREAYREIVERYMKRAYYLALSFVRNAQDAMDISQDAFIRAFRKIKKFDTKRAFFPWFYKLLKNLCLDHLKRSRRIHEVPLDGVRILKREQEDREMKEVLWQGIESLPMEQKEVIILRYFQQLSYKEIAETVDKPIGTVMSSLYYAKRKLKEAIGKFLGFDQ